MGGMKSLAKHPTSVNHDAGSGVLQDTYNKGSYKQSHN
jgi:hypothetical protein